MYQSSCGCNSDGLGIITELIGAAASLTGGESGGSSGGMSPGNTTVSPQISTQISPQISPVFQQQFQPQNSAATAGTSQVLPSMPSMMGPDGGGMVPGGVGVPGYAQPQTPMVPQVAVDWARYMPYALAAMGIFAFVALKKRGPKKAA